LMSLLGIPSDLTVPAMIHVPRWVQANLTILT